MQDTNCLLCNQSRSSWRHHNGPCQDETPHDHRLCHSFREPLSPDATEATLGVQRLTRQQAAIIGTFTGIVCGPFEDMQKLGDELLGRPTWTHEYGNQQFADDLKEKVRPQFIALCAERES